MKNFKCFHYDIGRGAYLKPEYFKKALEIAANAGYTHFLPYLENMIRLSPMEKASAVCAYSQDDWRDFDRFAAKAGIELIPHFNVIGHSREVCREYPELAGQHGGSELDVTALAVRTWTKQCLDEYCTFAKGKYFLIGGDEWQTPEHLLTKQGFNTAKAWAQQINFAVKILIKNGKIPIVWHDMLLHYPEALNLLSRDAVIAFWFYDEDATYPALDMLKTMGFSVIMATGITEGLLTNRRVKAIKCSVKNAEKYHSDGIMVTTWTDARFEKQRLNMILSGKLLAGQEIPRKIISAISAFELLGRTGCNKVFNRTLRRKIKTALDDQQWDEYPEYKAYLENSLAGNREQETQSFLQYHDSSGPLLNSICHGLAHSDDAPQGRIKTAVKAEIVRSVAIGDKIRITNGDESFVIYPEYGATLQDWRKGTTQIITHTLPRFAARSSFPPGGYRSYTGAGGFRPIWGFGSHQNPCIFWQVPFDWKIIENSAECCKIKLSRKLFHAEVNYTVTVRQGISGFIFEAEAVNKIENACCAFSFNLPVSVNPEILHQINLEYGEKSLTLRNCTDSFIVLPVKDKMTLKKDNIRLEIKSCQENTSGCYVDWSANFITPDFHGIYRKLKKNSTVYTRWEFSLK